MNDSMITMGFKSLFSIYKFFLPSSSNGEDAYEGQS